MIKTILLLTVLLLGCGKETQTAPLINVHFRLPASLKSPESRFERLKARAEYLEVKLKTKSGKSYENKFAPGSWDSIAIPQIDFPADEKDTLEIVAAVWDRKRDGSLRTFPALEGKIKLTASGVEKNKVTRAIIVMHLKVQPENFDH